MYIVYIYVAVRFIIDHRELFGYCARLIRFMRFFITSAVPVLNSGYSAARHAVAISSGWTEIDKGGNLFEIDISEKCDTMRRISDDMDEIETVLDSANNLSSLGAEISQQKK